MKRILLLSLTLAPCPFAAFAQEASILDSIASNAAKTFIQDRPWVQMSVGIVKDSQTYYYHYGAIERDKYQTVYEIGSFSKTFAGIILAHAIMENRVKLTDDIRKYLQGDYPNLAYKGHPIELLHLVNLTSGLPNNMPDSPNAFKDLPEDAFPFAFIKSHQYYTRTKLLEDLHQVTLDTIPGFNPRHSNSAAKLLVYILENIYRKPYPELVKAYILLPLQMNHTYVGSRANDTNSLAKGYNAKGLPMPYVPSPDVAAYGVTSTIGDMTRYIRFQLEEKDPAVRMTHQPLWGDANTFALGMNWFMGQTNDGKRRLNNDGTTLGFTTYILLYPALHYGVVAMTNEYDNDSNTHLGDLTETIFEEDYYTAAQRASDGFGFSSAINRLLDSLHTRGFDHAIAVVAKLKTDDTSFILGETEVNAWGYFLLGRGQKEKALEIFKLNVSLFPESWNVYDSLGETYASLGNKALAIQNYHRSLQLNPKNDNAVEQLKKLGAGGRLL